MTDPLGHTVTYSYDNAGRRSDVIDARGKITHYDYDDSGRLTKVTDPLGHPVDVRTYDAAGRLATETDGAGGTTSYTYDPTGRVATVTAPNGNVPGADEAAFTTSYFYDLDGNLVETDHPDPNGGPDLVTFTDYDTLGRPTAVTDPLDNTTTTDYDANGNPVAVTDPLNHVTHTSYDAANRVATTTDARGKVTHYTVDTAGNVLSQADPLGNTTSWTYDDDGRTATSVDPRGNAAGANPADFTTTYGYDPAGRLTDQTDPLGNHTHTDYDRAGNLAARADANQHVTRWTYDENNRLATVLGPDATAPTQTTSYGYDDDGRVTSRTDPLDHATAYGYDDAGRLTGVTDPLTRTRAYRYDPDGNQVATVTARGCAAGQPGGTSTTDAGTIVDTYDSLDRLTARTLGTGGPQYTWTYDAASRLTGTTDPAGSQTRGYDDADRLTAVDRGSQHFGYGYDNAGNVTTRTYPDSRTLTAIYNDANQLTSLTNAGATTTFGYDAASDPTTTTLPASNGYVEHRTFDRAGRLTEVGATRGPPTTTLADYQLTLDPVGNPTRLTTARGTTSRTDTYTYDPADRLTGVCYATTTCTGAISSIGYGYDLVGNRTSQTRAGVAQSDSTAYRYDTADELTSSATAGVTTSYGYDLDGNQTSAGAQTASYDLLNQTTSVSTGASTTSYAYDADGNRLSATTGATPTAFQWDINNQLPLLADETTGSTTRGYAYDPDLDPLALTTGGTTSYYTHDWLGSTSDLTATDGTPQYSYSYEPFGGGSGADPAPLVAGAPTNPLRFTGEYLDPTGQYYLRARQYDPTTARFTATDPATPDPSSPSTGAYVYTADDPTTLVDPTGECSVKARLKSLRPHFGKSACQLEDEARVAAASGVGGKVATGILNGAQDTLYDPRFDGSILASIGLLDLFPGLAAQLEGEGGLLAASGICRRALQELVSKAFQKLAAKARSVQLARRLRSAQKWPGSRLPLRGGPRKGFLIKRSPKGEITNYGLYDDAGSIVKRVDLTGRPHAGIPTPHTVEYVHDVAPNGQVYPRELPVRPALPEEIP